MNKLAVYGAGGHGKVIADTAELMGWENIHFFDENYQNYAQHGPWPVLGNLTTLCEQVADYNGVIVAIGNNIVRLEKQRLLQKVGAKFVSIIHPSAVISPYATLGLGSVVFAGAVINAFAEIGEAAIINTLASVDHDCKLADAVHICPGTRLAGNVTVGEATWIGIGSCVIQQIVITSNVYIGAGSIVIKNIEQSGKVFGAPAKLVKS